MGVCIQPLELLIEKASLVSPQKSPYTDVLNAGTVPWKLNEWSPKTGVPYGDPRYPKNSASNPKNEALLNWVSGSASIVQSSQKAHWAYSKRIGDSGDFCTEAKRTSIQKSWSMRLRSISRAVRQRRKSTTQCNFALHERGIVVFRKSNDSHGRFLPPFSLKNDEACLLYSRCQNCAMNTIHNSGDGKGAAKLLAWQPLFGLA